jgi:carbonic anhydrase
VPGFTDIRDTVRQSLATVRECRWIPHREDVRGFVFDVATACLEEIGDVGEIGATGATEVS